MLIPSYLPRPSLRPDITNINRVDSLAMPIMADMMRNGIATDVTYLEEFTEMLTGSIEDLEAQIRRQVPKEAWARYTGQVIEDDNEDIEWDEATDEGLDADIPPAAQEKTVPKQFNANSAVQKSWLLFDILGLADGKNLKRTAAGDRISVSKKQIEGLKKEHEVVKLILQHSEESKIRSTYTRALVKKVRWHKQGRCDVCGHWHYEGHNRIHTQFVGTRTGTGRLASRNPNLQNIPAKTALGKMVRKAFYAPKGMRLVGCDYSQIELRVLAHYSMDKTMLGVFAAGGDLHTATAMDVFGYATPDLVPSDERAVCKTVNFGIVYGLTADGLQAQLILLGVFWSKEKCQKFIDDYFASKPGIFQYMKEMEYRAAKYGGVWSLYGRWRYIPGVYSVHRHIVSEAYREAGNTPIQATAADIMKLGMAAMDYEFKHDFAFCDVRPLLAVHDEEVVETEKDQADDIKELMLDCMGSVVELEAIVKADGKVMECWEK